MCTHRAHDSARDARGWIAHQPGGRLKHGCACIRPDTICCAAWLLGGWEEVLVGLVGSREGKHLEKSFQKDRRVITCGGMAAIGQLVGFEPQKAGLETTRRTSLPACQLAGSACGSTALPPFCKSHPPQTVGRALPLSPPSHCIHWRWRQARLYRSKVRCRNKWAQHCITAKRKYTITMMMTM